VPKLTGFKKDHRIALFGVILWKQASPVKIDSFQRRP